MNVTLPASSRAWRGSVARSLVYTFLARSLAYPSEAHRAALERHVVPALRRTRSTDEGLATALGAALDAATPREELLPAYRALFPAVGQSDLPLNESVYRTRDLFAESEILADIAGFYRAHGLVVGSVERERPDHIAVELEFMAFLARKHAHAIAELGPAAVAACASAERIFLRDHLGTWAPLFGAALARVAPHRAYASVGLLLERWVSRERPPDTAPASGASEARPDRPAEDDACPLEVLA